MSLHLLMLGRGLRRIGPRWNQLSAAGAADAHLVPAYDAILDKLLPGERDTESRRMDRLHAELAWVTERAGNLQTARAAYRRLADRGRPAAWARQRLAAVSLVAGDLPAAVDIYQTLAEEFPGSALPELILGQLLLATGDPADAATHFMTAVQRLLEASPDTDPFSESLPPALPESRMLGVDQSLAPAMTGQGTRIARYLAAARTYLRQGRYVRAQETVEEALACADALLLAHGGLALATADHPKTGNRTLDTGHSHIPDYMSDALISLARLGDSLVKYAARVPLTSSVAGELKKRDLREDLATWATGEREIELLLNQEYQRLAAVTRHRPNHVELNVRVGVLARACNDLPAARRAFECALAVHPHHAVAAAKLAATLCESGETKLAADVLRRASSVDRPSLRQYYDLAVTYGEPGKFERTVAALENDLPDTAARAELKANLASALGSMGLCSGVLQEWSDPVHADVCKAA